jgi:hypothetical protein
LFVPAFPQPTAALEHHAVAYAGEALLWDGAQRQQLLAELVKLGGAVEAAFDGVPQVRLICCLPAACLLLLLPCSVFAAPVR